MSVPQESKQLSLHLVDFPQLEQSLPNDLPALVGVGIIHRDLGREHEGREEEAMWRRGGAACGGVARLEAGKEEEGLVGDGNRQAGAVEGVSLIRRE